jgi:hypothetical protein
LQVNDDLKGNELVLSPSLTKTAFQNFFGDVEEATRQQRKIILKY